MLVQRGPYSETTKLLNEETIVLTGDVLITLGSELQFSFRIRPTMMQQAALTFLQMFKEYLLSINRPALHSSRKTARRCSLVADERCTKRLQTC